MAATRSSSATASPQLSSGGSASASSTKSEMAALFDDDGDNIEDLFEYDDKKRQMEQEPQRGRPMAKTLSQEEADAIMEDWKDFCQLLPCVKIWTDWVISVRPRFPPHELNDLKTSRQVA